MTALELLAPAKNLACGIAAIDHGADAVYIGAPRFGARAAAGNSIDDICQLCSYAHQFGAKVYVTLNTIVYDDEIESVRTVIVQLEKAGVDAILVQDMAVLTMLQEQQGPMALHASTQTDNRTAEKVRWLRVSVMLQNTVSIAVPTVVSVRSSVACVSLWLMPMARR